MFSIFKKAARKKPRALGVLLCYNDGDILRDQIEYLLAQNHDVIAWDHGSDDDTAQVLDEYSHVLKQRKFIPRDFDFYKLYPEMSANVIENFADRYDMISWPDQDEFLEGPHRDKSYYEYLTDVYNSPYTYVEFQNFVYWYTSEDDSIQTNLNKRIVHYSLFSPCAPRIRAWKAAVTNMRQFNHNQLDGEKYPELFRLRHYPIRSEGHLYRRIQKDRASLEQSGANYHYNAMERNLPHILRIVPEMFHVDDGKGELDPFQKLNWDVVYSKEPISEQDIRFTNAPT